MATIYVAWTQLSDKPLNAFRRLIEFFPELGKIAIALCKVSCHIQRPLTRKQQINRLFFVHLQNLFDISLCEVIPYISRSSIDLHNLVSKYVRINT